MYCEPETCVKVYAQLPYCFGIQSETVVNNCNLSFGKLSLLVALSAWGQRHHLIHEVVGYDLVLLLLFYCLDSCSC